MGIEWTTQTRTKRAHNDDLRVFLLPSSSLFLFLSSFVPLRLSASFILLASGLTAMSQPSGYEGVPFENVGIVVSFMISWPAADCKAQAAFHSVAFLQSFSATASVPAAANR